MSKRDIENIIGFCGMIAILFIFMKALRVIFWSWVIVLASLWIPFLIFVFYGVYRAVSAIIRDLKGDKR